jgi:hypothetical protein
MPFFACGPTVFWCNFWPNKKVKGTRRPIVVLAVCFSIGFGGFAIRSFSARPLP